MVKHPPNPSYVSMQEHDLPAVSRILAHAFAGPRDLTGVWIKALGMENVRVMRDADGTTPACLSQIPMGQFFGGCRVPMVGIAGVGVAPEARGRGLAAAMMRACLRELHERGVPLSGLYCSTQALYRKVGYEQAGLRAQIRIPIARIQVASKARRVRPLSPDDDAAIRDCYTRFARRFSGPLDRGAYAWSRVARVYDADYHPFGFFDAHGQMQGYVYLAQQKPPGPVRHDVHLSDVAFLTPEAGVQILAFLADFEPTANHVVFHGSPSHPLLALLPQQRSSIEIVDAWMLRITHLKAAIEARRVAPGADGLLTIDVQDDTIPEHQGLWTLEMQGGRVQARRGAGGPVLRCTIGALAAMYAGLYPASHASLLGWCDGDDAAIARAEVLFPGAMPWMIDRF